MMIGVPMLCSSPGTLSSARARNMVAVAPLPSGLPDVEKLEAGGAYYLVSSRSKCRKQVTDKYASSSRHL